MGLKQIWDGKDLPPIGCQVLINLASSGFKAYEVVGYEVKRPHGKDVPAYHFIVNINVKSIDGKVTNQRFLNEVFPLDYWEVKND